METMMNKFQFGDKVHFHENDEAGHFGRLGVVVFVFPRMLNDTEAQYLVALEDPRSAESVHKSESELIRVIGD